MKNEMKIKSHTGGMANAKPIVLYIHYSIEDEDGLRKKLETLKDWYNKHWFMDKQVLLDQAKVYVGDHVKITVDEKESL